MVNTNRLPAYQLDQVNSSAILQFLRFAVKFLVDVFTFSEQADVSMTWNSNNDLYLPGLS